MILNIEIIYAVLSFIDLSNYLIFWYEKTMCWEPVLWHFVMYCITSPLPYPYPYYPYLFFFSLLSFDSVPGCLSDWVFWIPGGQANGVEETAGECEQKSVVCVILVFEMRQIHSHILKREVGIFMRRQSCKKYLNTGENAENGQCKLEPSTACL